MLSSYIVHTARKSRHEVSSLVFALCRLILFLTSDEVTEAPKGCDSSLVFLWSWKQKRMYKDAVADWSDPVVSSEIAVSPPGQPAQSLKGKEHNDMHTKRRDSSSIVHVPKRLKTRLFALFYVNVWKFGWGKMILLLFEGWIWNIPPCYQTPAHRKRLKGNLLQIQGHLHTALSHNLCPINSIICPTRQRPPVPFSSVCCTHSSRLSSWLGTIKWSEAASSRPDRLPTSRCWNGGLLRLWEAQHNSCLLVIQTAHVARRDSVGCS